MTTMSHHHALVTGASSGIGLAMARELANRGCSLTITARREDRLRELAETLEQEYGVDVKVIPIDLASTTGAKELWQSASQKPVSILINNAGFGAYRAFAKTPWQRSADLIQLNITSLVELSHLFLNANNPQNERYILNVASVLSFTSMRYFATYAASKAFVRNFSESVRDEYSDRSVSITCVSPGPTRTEFNDVSGSLTSGFAEKLRMPAEVCAQKAISAMLKGKKHITPGILAKLSVLSMQLMPRGVVGNLAGRFLPETE